MHLLFVITLFAGSSSAANILFLTLLGAPSHHIWNEAIIGQLLKNGHNITLLGHDKPKIISSNYTVMYIDDPYKDYTWDVLEYSKLSPSKQIALEWDYQYFHCELDLSSDVPKKLNDYPQNHFDLIVFDLGGGQCLYPLIDYFKSAKTIAVSPFGTPPSIGDTMGYHVPSYVPNYSVQYGSNMDFKTKIYNFFLQTYEFTLKHYYLSKMLKKSQEVYGKNIRNFYEVELDFDILLTNNDPILDYPQPFPPNIIPVGGLQTKRSKMISKEIENILDSAKDGVIYFSMGSIMKSQFMSNEIKEAFVDVFGKLKQTVLWKFEVEGLKVPKNVIIQKWFPQNEILAHKNVKLFISHCGGLSTQEAIYHGVPVLGIPIIIDQHNNAAKVTSKGGGLTLNYYDISKDKLFSAVSEILNNPSYNNEMKRLSTLFKDQQNHPLDRAIFWIEYMLRNKKTYKGDLNHRSRYMKYHEIYSIQIMIFVVLFISTSFVLCGLKRLINKCKSTKVDKKKKNN
nr:UDP-glucuronosyltransferase 1-9-like [Onthophagus taurus]